MKKTLLYLLYLLPFTVFSQTITINEVASINDSYADEDGNFPDWIELYNPNSFSISMAGWSITDDIEQQKKWKFPSMDIDSSAFLLMFASNKDRFDTAPMHTNFRLNGGEVLYLFNASGNLEDSLVIPELRANLSIGRYPDGSNITKFFEETTPNQGNSSVNFDGIINKEVSFFQAGGLYEDVVQVELSGAADGEIIRVTSNGTNPEESSDTANTIIRVDESVVLKAAIFKEGFLSGPVSTSTYIIGSKVSLPVLSLSFDPKDFFDDTSGIYVPGYQFDPTSYNTILNTANYYKDEERPVHVEFFNSNTQEGFSVGAGAKLFGGFSRNREQRSLSIFLRNRYGDKSLEYPLFKDRNYASYEAFVLRNSGNDWQSMLRDLTLTGLMLDSNVDIQAGRPVITYFNSLYWGIYNIREKVNEHYLASLHGISAEKITLLERNSSAIIGTNSEYKTLLDFVEKNDLNEITNYQVVADQIDLKNYIQYQLAQIYFDNTDWPAKNNKYWKPSNGKWRWILFDTDFGFGWSYANVLLVPQRSDNNTLSYALADNSRTGNNRPWATLLFRRLMTSKTFANTFINTFADELNTRFLSDNVLSKIDVNAFRIEGEINKHMERWNVTSSSVWKREIDAMKKFGAERPDHVRNHIQSYFDLPAQHPVNITIDDPAKGSIQLNTITLTDEFWSGIYFESVPISLKATAKPGHVFDRWSGAVESSEESVTIDPTQALSLTAHFKVSDQALAERAILFNEINYNSSSEKDAGDWVELYNNGPHTVDLSNWVFKDDKEDHIFLLPEGTTLASDGYLVLANSIEKFEGQFPNISNKIGNFDFKLSSSGEFIRLYDAQNELVDSLWYLPYGQWSEAANGTGATLELKMPEMDNVLGKNWAATSIIGTAGKLNTSNVACEIDVPFVPCDNLVLINEVNYNSSPEKDAGDWVELYNANDCDIDISNWIFKNNNNDHLVNVPEGTMLAANEFILLVANKSKFEEQFSTALNIIEGTNFDLSNDSDFIGLYDQSDKLTDFVWYNSDDSWPSNTNGTGATLELKSPELDNFRGTNWTSFPYNGTPGTVNGSYTTVIKEEDLAPAISIVPNPFVDQIDLMIGTLVSGNAISINLFDISGKLIKELYKKSNHVEEKIRLTIPDIAAGIYLFQIKVGEQEIMRKVVKY